jgi:predicted outer membrane protein
MQNRQIILGRPLVARSVFVACTLAMFIASDFLPAQTASSQDSVELAQATTESLAALLQSSRNANRQSKDARVRGFAGEVSSVAQRTDDRLRELCRQKNIVLPVSAPAHAPLDRATGETFDRVYTLETSQELVKARRILEAASKSPRIEGELREFAARTLPELRELGARADALAQAQADVGTGSPKG